LEDAATAVASGSERVRGRLRISVPLLFSQTALCAASQPVKLLRSSQRLCWQFLMTDRLGCHFPIMEKRRAGMCETRSG
jgi:hypothetical protein